MPSDFPSAVSRPERKRAARKGRKWLGQSLSRGIASADSHLRQVEREREAERLSSQKANLAAAKAAVRAEVAR